jgi:hypothetical protein
MWKLAQKRSFLVCNECDIGASGNQSSQRKKFKRQMSEGRVRDRRLIRPDSEPGRVADRVLAELPKRSEVFFNTLQYAPGSRPHRGTLLLDVRPAGLTDDGGLHQHRPALFVEILEMRLDASRRSQMQLSP